jgi:hypothetical protein
MRAREYLVLFALAACWGASFLFIRVAVAELSPLTLVGARSLSQRLACYWSSHGNRRS